MDETLANKNQFRMELFLALIITGLACAAGFSNLLNASNDLYPAATDYMGHIAKVQYIYESLRNGELPSWFPYWYCGSTVNQYYPPLPYYLMVPIYALAQNVMITFKIYCFEMLFIGGIGIWYFCRTIIGNWCGLFAIILYCLQPFLLTSLYIAGVVAQGPIYALTPWLLLSMLNSVKNPKKINILSTTVLTVLMILSHAMHAFIIVFSIMVVLLIFIPLKKVQFINYIMVAISIVFSGFLTAFWSLVGVTKFENPTIPYIQPGATANVTATEQWFDPKRMGSLLFYFAFPVLVITAVAALVLIYRASKRQFINMEKLEISFCIGLTFFTLLFSFGNRIPGFQYLPMSENLVPGRILSLTSVTGAVSGAYLFFLAIRKIPTLKALNKVISSVIIVCAFGFIVHLINPYQYNYSIDSYDRLFEQFKTVNATESAYDKGRWYIFAASSSNEANLPLLFHYNLADGWNIEGTPHNRVLWYHDLCSDTGTGDYFAKNIAFWNVRYLSLPSSNYNLAIPLQQHLGFIKYGKTFYASEFPSSYFLTDPRNALIIGVGSPGLAMEFPYLVYEQRDNLTDYSMDELDKYKLIYLCEPDVETLQKKEAIEKRVKELVRKGITVMIEPTMSKGYALFDVTVADVVLENTPVIRKQPGSEINSTVDNIEIDLSMKYGRALFGLDKVYYKLVQNGGSLESDIIGAKKVENGEVVFIGKHLSQYLKAVYARNWGVPQNATGFPASTKEVKALFEDIFSTYGVDKDFLPDPFPIKKAYWSYKGVDFTYSSLRPQEITISVTYTPRWKASLDGKPIPVGQKENLVTLNLPAGDHEVKLVYGLTKYGIAGYIISLAGFVLFILFLKFYDIILYKFKQINLKFGRFLQLIHEE